MMPLLMGSSRPVHPEEVIVMAGSFLPVTWNNWRDQR